MNVTTPGAVVTPDTLIEYGPPVRYTVAPVTLAPIHWTVACTVPDGGFGSARLTVVDPVVTVVVVFAVSVPFVAVTV